MTSSSCQLPSKGLRFLLCAFLIGMYACNQSEITSERPVRVGKGGVKYGGLFRMNITNDTRSIFPHDIVDASAANLMSQVYEGLLSIDADSKRIVPALAESYSVSADGTLYTFQLRKGVRFHDDKVFDKGQGRELKAGDVVNCFTKLCEPSKHNQLYSFLVDLIKGGRKHYDATSDSKLEGVRAVNDYTVEIELEYPAPTFLSILTHPCSWIFPKELYQYKKDISAWCIGTGPFKARTIKMNEVMIFERNKHYWRKDSHGNTLPYLDAVRSNFILNESKQLDLFLEGNLDLLLQVPFKSMAALKSNIEYDPENTDYRILTTPALKVEYYGFQLRDKLFSDVRIRKAVNYAINRQMIVDSVLQGYGQAAVHGFIPPAMPAYNTDSIDGYEYNPAQAKRLMMEAGYENGINFPVLSLQVNDGNENALMVAEAVQKMLADVLDLTVEISVLPRDRHYEQIENGNVKFWRDSWIADYADPENFLRLFHGSLVPDDSVKASFLNTVRFKNEKFDQYFEASLRELDERKRYADYENADQVLMDEATVVPLYFEKWIWLVRRDVKNLDVTGIGILDLSRVYFNSDASLPAVSDNF